MPRATLWSSGVTMRPGDWWLGPSTLRATTVPISTYGGSFRGWLLIGEGGQWLMTSIHPALGPFLGEIERALAAQLYWAALTVALSVPDVFSWLMNDPSPEKVHINRRRQSRNYKAWFD